MIEVHIVYTPEIGPERERKLKVFDTMTPEDAGLALGRMVEVDLHAMRGTPNRYEMLVADALRFVDLPTPTS